MPQYLGYIRSADGGRTWKRRSTRSGSPTCTRSSSCTTALYAWDAVLSAMLISDDGGKTFTEHFTPRGLIIDFEVDPDDPDTIVAATEEQLYRSTDGGDSWRPALREPGVRVAWSSPDRLFIATRDGTVQVSADGGDTTRRSGPSTASPTCSRRAARVCCCALSDGTVLTSADEGASWEEVFRP